MRIAFDTTGDHPPEMVVCRTAAAATAVLAGGEVTEISFLHDADQYEAGLAVAEFIKHEVANGRIPMPAWQVKTKVAGQAEELVRAMADAASAARVREPSPAVSGPEFPFASGHLLGAETFESLFLGESNALACAHGLLATDISHPRENPLCIIGPKAVGKTHLLHAIGNRIARDKPRATIAFVHGYDYAQAASSAYLGNAIASFEQKYLDADVLLFDDIQGITRVADRLASQRSAIRLFDALAAKAKQIVLTSAIHPAEDEKLDPVVARHLSGGLLARIREPDADLRMRILRSRARDVGVDLPNELASFIAAKTHLDTRQLLGVLSKTLAYASFHSRDVSLETAIDALAPI